MMSVTDIRNLNRERHLDDTFDEDKDIVSRMVDEEIVTETAELSIY